MTLLVTRIAATCLAVTTLFLVLGTTILNAENKRSNAEHQRSNSDPKWNVTKPDLSQELMDADNSYCLVCHINLEEEELVATHQPYGIGCELCHGMSIEHSADENNLTPPEIMWPKFRINTRCLTCHDKDKMMEDPKAAKAHKKMLADMTKPDRDFTRIRHCTKCHGKHKIDNRTRTWDKETGEVVEQSGGPIMDR